MKSVLSQSEIDNLINGIGSGDIELEEIKKKNKAEIKVYDFSRPNKFSHEQKRIIREMYEDFSRMVAPSLSTNLRAFCETFVAYVDEQTFYEYLNSLPKTSVLGIVDFEPLDGSILIEISGEIANAIINIILGGTAKKDLKKKPYSDIERALLSKAFEAMEDPLKESWRNVVALKPKLESVEINSQHAQIVSASETVAIITLKTTITGIEGFINICIPYGVIEPISNKLTTKYMVNSKSNKKSGENEPLNDYFSKKIEEFYLELVCELGKTTLTFEELKDLQTGDVLMLDKTIKDTVDLNINDSLKFRGVVGSKKGKIAVKIVEVAKGDEDYE